MNHCQVLTLLLAGLVAGFTPGVAGAQSVEEAVKAEAIKKAAAARSARPSSPAKSEGDKSSTDKKGSDKSGSEGSNGKAEEDEKPKVITRPDVAEKAVDMAALRKQVGSDGQVRFNLEGVPWPDLLQWLADAASLSLDWQELPADALNLRTQRPYSIEEARDVINRHLLSRGFTMLKHGELLSVVNVSKLNPGLVPRVRPDELDQRMPHEFVKTSFVLDWLIAEKAVEELKPMLSPNGKLTALASTNRLEAVDAVVNLQELRTVLNEEQTTTGDKRVVDVFHLEHVRADETVGLLEQILGMESTRGMAGGVDDNTGRMIMQQLQQLQKNMQRSSSSSSKGGGNEEEEPKLIVNERDNSIVAHAPPDKMEIIRQTVTALDTPAARRGSTLHTKIFRLSTVDPATLVTILNELGDFPPNTKMTADETNGSLIVQGTLSDLNSVWELVQELDGSTRNFEVIPLRRLAADEVAGTIEYLMGSEDDSKKNDNSGYYSYYSYRYSRGGNQKSNEDKRPFKVDADLENNRLLLWANEVELEEVQNLLIKMGEIPSGEGSNETFRVIDLSTDEDADAVLERIRRMWPGLAPNDLEIRESAPASRPPESRPSELRPPATTEPSSPPPEEAPEANGPSTTPAAETRTTSTKPSLRHPLLLARNDETPSRLSDPDKRAAIFQRFTNEQSDEDRPQTRDVPVPKSRWNISQGTPSSVVANVPQAPPIVIQRGVDGKIIIQSSDTRALDRLEGMMADVAPLRRDYHIFHLQYSSTWAYDVELILRDFFKGEIEGTPTLDWFGGVVNQRDNSPSRLSKRRQLKIISDEGSRTILVQGATPSQLDTIGHLIEIYDRPTTGDPQALRTMQFFHLQNAPVQTVADTLKAVYRDLLSTNDPALRDPNDDKENRPQNTGTTISYTYSRGNGESDGDLREEPARIEYDGLLSVGIDEVSNTLVISAIEGLMPEISQIVKTLDEAAEPENNFQVISLDPNINPAMIQSRLQKLLEARQPQTGQPGNQNQNEQPPAGEGNRNGNNRGRRGPGGN